MYKTESQYLLSWWPFGNLPAVGFCAAIAFAQEDSVRFIRDSIQIQPEFNESLFSPFELPSENSAPSSMFHPEHSYSLPDFH